MMLYADTIATPIGDMFIVAGEGALVYADFDGDEARRQRLLARRFGDTRPANQADPYGISAALVRYFAGDLAALDELAISTGGTTFQQLVWDALRAIPIGQTLSYGELARRLGAPSAARAVGMANGQNPISVVVPCHRLVGAGRTLTGYAGGLERKRWLLRHERALL